MKTTRKRAWGAMTAAQLAEATKEFDKPLAASRYKPLSKRDRAQFDRARRAGARGRELVAALDLDADLIKEAEAYARRKKLTWAELLERGLRRELAVED